MGKSKGGKSNNPIPNHMKQVFCPSRQYIVWGNSTKHAGEYRCVGCGLPHRV